MACTAWGNDNLGVIKGVVKDSQTNEAIAYASVALKKGQEVITGTMTDDQGGFALTAVPYGSYTLEIHFIGYQAGHQEIILATKTTDLGIISLRVDEAETMLEEVNVVAERSSIEQKIDRKVVNVGKDLTTVGATASDILGNIPSLHVDQDGNLSLRGNTNVRVLIDGRPSNMDVATLLKQIPSASIKSVELITNPSAKYNPEGMSGIINIILHKNTMDGINGSVSSTVTFANTPKWNNTLNLNYRKGKLNFYGNAGHNTGRHANDGDIYMAEDQSSQLFDIENKSNNFFYKLGVDWYINDHNTLSAYTNQTINKGTGDVRTTLHYPLTGTHFGQNDWYDNQSNNHMYNLAYKHAFEKPGHTLDFELTFSENNNDQTALFTPVSFPNDAYRDAFDFTEESWVANLDYSLPVDAVSRLEFGGEFRQTATANDYQTSRVGGDAAGFEYQYAIYSAYATWGQKWSKWSYQLGMRLESYQVEADYRSGADLARFANDYVTVYPSAYLNYVPNEVSSWNLSLTRRVDRPSVQQTQPIRNFSTPRVTSVGNPELLPQFTNSLELNYTHKLGKQSLSAGVFVRDINDQISQTVYPDLEADPADKKIIMSFTNFDKNTSYGVDVSANLKPTTWWDLMPGVDFSSIRQKGVVAVMNNQTNEFDYTLEEVTTNALNARLNNTFKASKQLSFSLFGFYRGEVESVQNISKPMYRLDGGARYAFWDNKANLSLRFTDMFNTMRFAFDSKNPYPGDGEFRWESQSFIVSFNYNFGTSKTRALQRKQREDNTSKASGVF